MTPHLLQQVGVPKTRSEKKADLAVLTPLALQIIFFFYKLLGNSIGLFLQ